MNAVTDIVPECEPLIAERATEPLVFVYKITCAATGKAYIGVTIAVQRRWREHLKGASWKCSRGLLVNAIRKYGKDNFKIEVLLEVVSCAEALLAEREMIVLHDTMTPAGYNMTSGGETSVGRRLSAEVKKSISNAAKAQWADPVKRARAVEAMQGREIPEYHVEHLRRQAAAMRGVPKKPEAIEKMRAKLIGHEVSEETRAKISASGTGKHEWAPEQKERQARLITARWEAGAYANRAGPTPEQNAASGRSRLRKRRGPYKGKTTYAIGYTPVPGEAR